MPRLPAHIYGVFRHHSAQDSALADICPEAMFDLDDWQQHLQRQISTPPRQPTSQTMRTTTQRLLAGYCEHSVRDAATGQLWAAGTMYAYVAGAATTAAAADAAAAAERQMAVVSMLVASEARRRGRSMLMKELASGRHRGATRAALWRRGGGGDAELDGISKQEVSFTLAFDIHTDRPPYPPFFPHSPSFLFYLLSVAGCLPLSV
jgi:hypothetical protein